MSADNGGLQAQVPRCQIDECEQVAIANVVLETQIGSLRGVACGLHVGDVACEIQDALIEAARKHASLLAGNE